MDSLTIKTYFNKAAETYDDHCYIQNLIGNKLIGLTKNFKPYANNIIDLGCGTGTITEVLVKAYNHFKYFSQLIFLINF